MKRISFLSIALLLAIFTSRLQAEDNEDNVLNGNEITLNLCTDDRIGYQIKCNPDWIINDELNSVSMIIVDEQELLVTATINKSNEKGITLKQLTPERLRFIGQYGDEVKIDRVQVAGMEAIKVKATAKDVEEMQLLDYYFVKDNFLYSVLFSVNPSERFPDFEGLFEKMIKSFEII